MQRQSILRLHHAEHHLARDHALFGHAELTHLARLLRQPGRAYRRHVVEHHGQVLIDQGAQQAGEHFVDFVLVIDHGIHGAQQVLMVDRFSHDSRQSDRLDPAQHAEFGVRVTQPVEHHHANQRLDIDAMAGATKHLAQAIKAERIPQLGQRPDITKIPCRFKPNGRSRRRLGQGLAGHPQQAGDHRLQLGAELIEPPQRGDRALPGPAGVVAICLDKLHIAARSGVGDFDKHATTLNHKYCNNNLVLTPTNVPLQLILLPTPKCLI